MTMTEWVATLTTDAQGNIELETFADGGRISVTPENLTSLLSGVATVPPSYAELSALPIARAGGWQKYFDDWQSKGVIT